MDLVQHSREDRIASARLAGILGRHASRGTDTAAAVAELHTVSTDPHLLAHAFTVADWLRPRAEEILAAAGADMDEAKAIRSAPPGSATWLGRMADNTR